jgi:hypothetical protein
MLLFSAFMQRRVGHEQALDAAAITTADAEGRHFFRQGCGMLRVQPFQRGDHVLSPGEGGAALVGAEFALAREPHDDDRGENAEHQFGDDHGDEEGRPLAALGLEHDAIHQVADDARQEHDEGVHHALDQRQRHHVAVGDVGDFVTDDGFRFALRHLPQEAAGNRDQ